MPKVNKQRDDILENLEKYEESSLHIIFCTPYSIFLY